MTSALQGADMIDFNNLQRAGHSTTNRAWITNPVRRSLLAIARPYFTYLLGALGELEQRLPGSGGRQHHDDSLKDELLNLSRTLDSLRKDQMAVNYRLGSIEDQVDEQKKAGDGAQAALLRFDPAIETLQQQLVALGRRVADSGVAHTTKQVSGIATLPHNLPLAIRGTSLVLHDGPYGCFMLRQPDLISDQILAGNFWDQHLKSVIERVGGDRTAIDAGAYLGFHTVYMSRYFRTVRAFEPQVEIYRMLCANVLLNNCRNVIAVNAALYDVVGHMSLAEKAQQELPVPSQGGDVDYGRICNAAALAFRLVEGANTATVPAQTVDQLGLTDLGFLKVDTQGSDLHVLRGACATMQRCRPIIAIEFERELAKIHNSTLDDYHELFNDLGYVVEVLDERGNGKQIDLLATPR